MDPVDRIVEQWAGVHPSLDTAPMAIIGRVHRLSRAVAECVEQHSRAHGIGRGDYDVLASLRRAGDPAVLTPGQLCSGLLLHRPASRSGSIALRRPASSAGAPIRATAVASWSSSRMPAASWSIASSRRTWNARRRGLPT